MNLIKSRYEHMLTKKKYNVLNIKYEEMTQRYEEKVIELDKTKEANRILKRKFDNEYDELLKKYTDLKIELKELKKRKRRVKE